MDPFRLSVGGWIRMILFIGQFKIVFKACRQKFLKSLHKTAFRLFSLCKLLLCDRYRRGCGVNRPSSNYDKVCYVRFRNNALGEIVHPSLWSQELNSTVDYALLSWMRPCLGEEHLKIWYHNESFKKSLHFSQEVMKTYR